MLREGPFDAENKEHQESCVCKQKEDVRCPDSRIAMVNEFPAIVDRQKRSAEVGEDKVEKEKRSKEERTQSQHKTTQMQNTKCAWHPVSRMYEQN